MFDDIEDKEKGKHFKKLQVFGTTLENLGENRKY